MENNFNIDCTGDVVSGDTIQFSEDVWEGSWRNPIKVGKRIITAKVVKDSYGNKKQQHTFTLVIISCNGNDCIKTDTKTTRKGRNVYRKWTKRLLWKNEDEREVAIKEKHKRGSIARKSRTIRREYEHSNF